MTEASDYLLGSTEAELQRLGEQHEVWSAYARDAWRYCKIQTGHTVADLGCGPGDASIELARLVGSSGRVIGIDNSETFVRELELRSQRLGLQQINARYGDLASVELEPNSIDSAYARWVLCFVQDPFAVIERVATALKPGGTMAVFDYYNYHAFALAPRAAAMEPVVNAVIASWADSGGDIDIMMKVPGYFSRAGLEVERIDPVARVAAPGSPLWNWPLDFFRLFLPTLIDGNYISKAESDAFLSAWESRRKDPHAFLCTPPMMSVIARKP